MARYYCDCDKGKYKNKLANKFIQMQRVDVDKNGCCVFCGSYAYARANEVHELFPRTKYLRDTEPTKDPGKWANRMEAYWQYFFQADAPKWGQKKMERHLYDKARAGGVK